MDQGHVPEDVFPCERFGQGRAGEIQALIKAVTGQDCRHGLNGEPGTCPVLDMHRARAAEMAAS